MTFRLAARFHQAFAILLANRLCGTGTGQKTVDGVRAAAIEQDELDKTVLNGVSMAGSRFQQMLRTLQACGAGPLKQPRFRKARSGLNRDYVVRQCQAGMAG